MNITQANVKAQEWWGETGRAVFIPYKNEGAEAGRYVVGVKIPGNAKVTQYGTSRVSFENAFEQAEVFGCGPVFKQ